MKQTVGERAKRRGDRRGYERRIDRHKGGSEGDPRDKHGRPPATCRRSRCVPGPAPWSRVPSLSSGQPPPRTSFSIEIDSTRSSGSQALTALSTAWTSCLTHNAVSPEMGLVGRSCDGTSGRNSTS